MKKQFLTTALSISLGCYMSTVAAQTINYPNPDSLLKNELLDARFEKALFADSSINNTVSVTSDIVGRAYGGYWCGAMYLTNPGADVTGNTINLKSGTVSDFVGGGRSLDIDAKLLNNKVAMSGGTTDWAAGGIFSIFNSRVENNGVILSGGTVDSVYGATYYNEARSTRASEIPRGYIGSNWVVITGGNIGTGATGQKIIAGSSLHAWSTSTSNNTVSIIDVNGGNINIGSGVSIYGTKFSDGSNQITTDTLNLAWRGTVQKVANFHNYNFTLVKGMQNGSTLLTVNSIANIDASNMKLVGSYATTNWKNGDKVTLLSQTNGGGILYNGQLSQGLSAIYDYTMGYGLNNAVEVTFTGVNANSKADNTNTGLISSMAFLSSAEGLIDNIDSQEKIFAAAKYSSTKLKLNSSSDIKGTSMILGGSRKYKHKSSHTILSGFVEAGWGSYDSYSDTAEGRIHGAGNSNYYGLGMIATNKRDDGVYSKGIVRLGRSATKYNSTEVVPDQNITYDVNSTYYGITLQLGKVIKLDEKNNLDVYGRYAWLHQTGADAVMLGERIEFGAIDSHRLKAGARLNHQVKDGLKTYFDLAYEYELGGEAKANGAVGLRALTLQGGTAIAELGVYYKPKKANNFSMSLGLQGYTGKRQGIGGNMHLKWEF